MIRANKFFSYSEPTGDDELINKGYANNNYVSIINNVEKVPKELIVNTPFSFYTIAKELQMGVSDVLNNQFVNNYFIIFSPNNQSRNFDRTYLVFEICFKFFQIN